MLRYAMRSLRAHRGRLLLTAAAIVLGVGVVSGTYVLTDTARAAAQQQLTRGNPTADLVVRAMPPDEARDWFFGPYGQLLAFAPVPAAAVAQAGRVAGVAAATGVITGDAQLVGGNGRVVSGRPSIGRSVDPALARALTAGRAPTGPGEVALDARTADAQELRVGDQVRVIAAGADPRTVTVVGLLNSPELPAAVIVGFDPATAARQLAGPGEVSYVEVRAGAGQPAARLRDQLAAALGPDYQVVTGASLATARAAEGQLDPVLRTIFLGAGVVALFVGTFVIGNTYTIILAARTRELALLRCMGASRRQLFGSVLLESGVVGLLAAGVGVVFGIAVAAGMAWLISMFQATVDLAGTAPRVLPRTVLVALAVGVVTATVSAWGPARRATQVAPVAALRGDMSTLDRRASRVRALLGGLAVAGGTSAVLSGALADPAASALLWAGSAATVLGVVLLGPTWTGVLSQVLGAPVSRVFGAAGQLARANAARSPRRTAATVLPLVVGLGLVSFLTTVAEGGLTYTINRIDEGFLADHRLAATGARGNQPAMSPQVARRLAGLAELDTVAVIQRAGASVAGRHQWLAAADPARLARTVAVHRNVVDGTLADLGPGGVAVSRRAARAHRLRLGSTLPVQAIGDSAPVQASPQGRAPVRAPVRLSLTVRAIYDQADDTDGDGRVYFSQLRGYDFLITPVDHQRLNGDPAALEIYTTVRAGTSHAAAQAAMQQALADYPQVLIQDRAAVHRLATAGLDAGLQLLNCLLALAVLVALLGIVNTLVLSTLERTRELGLLRAVGMRPRQIRAMVCWEGLFISGAGTTVGVALGAFLGWAAARAAGLPGISMPLVQLSIFAGAGLVAGVLAAALPARRAARVNLLRALGTS